MPRHQRATHFAEYVEFHANKRHEEAKRDVSNDGDWMKFRQVLQNHFATLQDKQFFTTNVSGSRLYEAYLAGFSNENLRSVHECTSCEHFITKYGNLVYFDSPSQVRFWGPQSKVSFWDPSWPGLPDVYKLSVMNMKRLVEAADLTGVFYALSRTLGKPVTQPFYHFFATFETVYSDAEHRSAIKNTEFETVRNVFESPMISIRNVDQALELLRSGVLFRSEKCLPHAEWLCKLMKAVANSPNPKLKDEVIWRYVAKAPEEFFHIRSSILGTLLADINNDVPVQELTKSFNDKMDPLQYQRAQVAPKPGNVNAMHKMIQDMGLDTALERRFARLHEIEKLWEPVLQPPVYDVVNSGALCDVCESKDDVVSAPIVTKLNLIRITWVKFLKTVLSQGVVDMEYLTVHARDNFCAIITAVHANAKPILQWDQDPNKQVLEDGPPVQRNPFSWYVWNRGSRPEKFGLALNRWHKVSAVTLKPCMWFNANFPHHGQGVIFILQEARESNPDGMGFFTEMLRSELHCVRFALEQHAQNHKICAMEKGDAIGILLANNNANAEVRVRVKMPNGNTFEYLIDRYE